MRTEYNCSCGKVNTTQYAMRVLNHSGVEQLCSLFRYTNEFSVNTTPDNVIVWVDRVDSFSYYSIDKTFWVTHIVSGELTFHNLLIEVLAWNFVASILEPQVAITTAINELRFNPNLIVLSRDRCIGLTEAEGIIAEPLYPNRTLLYPEVISARYRNNIYDALLSAPLMNLWKDMLLDYVHEYKWMDKEARGQLLEQPRPVVKGEISAWMAYLIATTRGVYNAYSLAQLPPASLVRSDNLEMFNTIKSGDKDEYHARILDILTYSTREKHSDMAGRSILGDIQTKHTRLDGTLISLPGPRKLGWQMWDQEFGFQLRGSELRAFPDWLDFIKRNKPTGQAKQGFWWRFTRDGTGVPGAEAFFGASKSGIKYAEIDQQEYKIIKRAGGGAWMDSTLRTVERLQKRFERIMNGFDVEKLRRVGPDLTESLFGAERILRGNLLVLDMLLGINAGRSTGKRDFGFKDTLLNYLRRGDMLHPFLDDLSWNKFQKPTAIDALRLWWNKFQKPTSVDKDNIDNINRYAKPTGLEERPPDWLVKVPRLVGWQDTDQDIYRVPKPVNDVNDVQNQKPISKSTSTKVAHIDIGGKPIATVPRPTHLDNEYMDFIKELVDIYDDSEGLIRLTLDKTIGLYETHTGITPRNGLNVHINEVLSQLSAPELDMDFLTDLELVLTNPMYKDIILDDKKIIIDDVANSQWEEWDGEGIDELLIPNEDYPWETMKQDIFDWEKGVPKEPLERLGDHTFKAKMPTVNPVFIKWDVGRKYVDLEVFWLKYIVEVFYKTWQSNVFKYGAMDMMSGINTMLEYMRLYVEFDVPGNVQEQCRRAVSLIRWYAEYVLLKHSQFIIHVEYGHWTSSLHTGVLDIDHDKVNFEITPTFILQNTDDRATLIIRSYVCIDSAIDFSIFLDGDVKLYINKQLVAEMTTGCETHQVYALAAGDVEIKFDFTGTEVKLGNLRIDNTHAVDIKTEYKYEYGKANFGIHEVLNSVKAYYGLTEDNLEEFKKYRDGLIGLNDLTNHLREYMELHHINQQKGKRLTIKRL
jgi:hypothetical protein